MQNDKNDDGLLNAEPRYRPADRMALKFVWLLSANHRYVL